MKTLVPCAGCGRHVRTSDAACPFCGHAIESDAASRAVPRSNGARLGRAALFAFGATIAATAAACSPATPGNDAAADSQVQDSGTMALYGGPPVDSGVPDADDGSPGARYGAVPVPDASDDASDGSPGARYGAPPQDAG